MSAYLSGTPIGVLEAPSRNLDSPLAGWGTPSWSISREPFNVHSNAYANALQVKTGPGVLFGFTAYSSKGTAQFIQIHDKVTVPVTGDIPCTVFTVAATAHLPISFVLWRTFEVGCWIVNSSTGPTCTLGSADTFFDAQYV